MIHTFSLIGEIFLYLIIGFVGTALMFRYGILFDGKTREHTRGAWFLALVWPIGIIITLLIGGGYGIWWVTHSAWDYLAGLED